MMEKSVPLETFLPYMRDVGKCEQSLHELNLNWRMIESAAKLNCPQESQAILPAMAATRATFRQLEEELVRNLVQQKLRNMLDELATRAQYVIDIVVRNLYERTADVGFLATDHELCSFVARCGTGSDDDPAADAGLVGSDTLAAQRARIAARLRAYRDKYTVYDEIVLFDVHGRVLVRLDESSPLDISGDPLLAQALASDTYVETFRASELQPGKREALIYARRMCDPASGHVIGVLCLCFAFEEEMGRIFATHRDRMDRSNMLLLDGANRVIASADERWIPLGTPLPVNPEAVPAVMMYAGREYLVRTHASSGYQGYPGPAGWQGQVMIPLDVAFNRARSAALAELEPQLAAGLLSHADTFCPPLFDIMRAAESAADTIRRVVWNGQLTTSGQSGELVRLKSILEQISETGTRSSELFAQSIRDLFETVLAAGLRTTESVSHLLVDLLDRNLYERANDCRWWAVTPELRTLLAEPERSQAAAQRLQQILEYINSLYTVYAGLVVYDRDGRPVASTVASVQVGGTAQAVIDPATLAQVLSLRSEQDYHVTPFAPTPLYGDAPTFVYHAAIGHPDQPGRNIGGIGIVFDATPEFNAMLRGALGAKDGEQAFFIDREGTILASTDAAHPVGARLELDADLLALDNGASASRIAVRDGQYALIGCTVSHGYREFKVSDGYRDDIIGVVVAKLGAVRAGGDARRIGTAPASATIKSAAGPEFAMFYVDGNLFAVATAAVLEALPAASVASVSIGTSQECIGVIRTTTGQPASTATREAIAAQAFVWVFDLGAFLSGERTAIAPGSQVVVVRHGARARTAGDHAAWGGVRRSTTDHRHADHRRRRSAIDPAIDQATGFRSADPGHQCRLPVRAARRACGTTSAPGGNGRLMHPMAAPVPAWRHARPRQPGASAEPDVPQRAAPTVCRAPAWCRMRAVRSPGWRRSVRRDAACWPVRR